MWKLQFFLPVCILAKVTWTNQITMQNLERSCCGLYFWLLFAGIADYHRYLALVFFITKCWYKKRHSIKLWIGGHAKLLNRSPCIYMYHVHTCIYIHCTPFGLCVESCILSAEFEHNIVIFAIFTFITIICTIFANPCSMELYSINHFGWFEKNFLPFTCFNCSKNIFLNI